MQGSNFLLELMLNVGLSHTTIRRLENKAASLIQEVEIGALCEITKGRVLDNCVSRTQSFT